MLLVLFAAFVGVCKAVLDKLNDHWEASIFYRWSGGMRDHFFGHRDYVYRRRYDANGEKYWYFRVPVLANVLEAVWDLYHLVWTALILGSLALVWHLLSIPWWWMLSAWAVYFAAFEVPYRHVLAR